MSQKKIILFLILAITSILSGASLGLLDFFGFIDGRHELSFFILGFSIALLYVSIITTFILNFAPENRIYTFLLVSTVLFGVPFFFMSLSLTHTFITSGEYFLFLLYAYKASYDRSKLFITFSPDRIFFPVLKQSLTMILILFSLFTFFQSQKLIAKQSLITPDLIGYVSKPAIAMFNKQVNASLSTELDKINIVLTPRQKEEIIRATLDKSFESLADPQTNEVYGIPLDQIPLDEATITEDGVVDFTPVFNDMKPIISTVLNQKLLIYKPLAPFVIAFLTYLILQPFAIPLQFFEFGLTWVIFKILLATRFIQISSETKQIETLHL